MKFGIVGAGIAGLACAELLACEGHEIQVFDKGRGPGGRLSTCRAHTPLGEAAFDHGAQYLSPQDEEFRAQLEAWEQLGVVEPWPQNAPLGWVGVPHMSAIIKHMARDRNVKFETLVKGLIRSPEGWHLYCDASNPGPFDGVIVAVPAEQAITLLGVHDFQAAKAALHAPSTACWTAMFAFPAGVSSRAFVRDQGNISWAARNSSKPGRNNIETWVVQAEADWSKSHLEEEADWIALQLFDELSRALGRTLPGPVYRAAHRWRYAANAGNGLGAIWRPTSRLGVCGDWLLGPEAESAWLSGRCLAKLILQSDRQSIESGSLRMASR